MLYTLEERRVELRGSEHFVAHNATLIGSIVLEDRSSVWFNAVLRGDCDLIQVGEDSNIQDGSVLHTDPGVELVVGRGVTVGHMAMLHGCSVGDHSLIGIGAVILNGTRIGSNCLIGARALIPEGKEIPDNSLVVGAPGRIVRQLSDAEIASLRHSAESYVERMRQYRRSLELDPRSRER